MNRFTWRRSNQPAVVDAEVVPPEETPIAITESDLIKLNEKGMTRLHEAVEVETPDLKNINNLISMAEKFDIKDKFLNMRTRDTEMTALHYAVEKNNNQIVKILVGEMDNNDGLKIQDNEGDTALHTATVKRLFPMALEEEEDWLHFTTVVLARITIQNSLSLSADNSTVMEKVGLLPGM